MPLLLPPGRTHLLATVRRMRGLGALFPVRFRAFFWFLSDGSCRWWRSGDGTAHKPFLSREWGSKNHPGLKGLLERWSGFADPGSERRPGPSGVALLLDRPLSLMAAASMSLGPSPELPV
jgi:hypothetical protein